MVNTDFLISPAYQVPQIATTFVGEIDQDDAVRCGAVELRIGLEARQVAGS